MGNPGQTQAFAALQRRLGTELDGALKRRPPSEAKLAGALRAAAPFCAPLRAALAEAGQVLVRRASFDRELYACAIRALVEAQDKRAAQLLKSALAGDDGGGLATLSAACFSLDPSLSAPLAKAANSRHAQLAFGAEVARLGRGEGNGGRLAALAPRIKESHRIALCVELFVPLTRGPSAAFATLSAAIAPALKVLRDAERHLGRWLVLAEVATRAGDPEPLAEARRRTQIGAESSRAAWSLVAWALDDKSPFPATRPTVELVARLSDRPSADRDTTFLFRMARARAPTAKGMLESLVRGPPAGRRALPFESRDAESTTDEVAIRAARCLARDYGRDDLLPWLARIASGKREELRGIAAAALWDAGDREAALEAAEAALASKTLGAHVWAALVKAAPSGHPEEVLSEATFRRVQWGWVE